MRCFIPADIDERRLNSLAVKLSLAYGLVAGIFAFAGVRDRALYRMFRNEAVATIAGLVVVVIGLAIAAFVPVARARDVPTLRRKFVALVAATAVFVSGVAIVLKVAADTRSTVDRPEITAQVDQTDDGPVVTGRIRAQGLRSTDHVHVVASAYPATGPTAEPQDACGHRASADTRGDVVLRTRSGPDADGAVSYDFEVPVEPGAYTAFEVVASISGEGTVQCEQECREADRLRACWRIELPSSHGGADP